MFSLLLKKKKQKFFFLRFIEAICFKSSAFPFKIVLKCKKEIFFHTTHKQNYNRCDYCCLIFSACFFLLLFLIFIHFYYVKDKNVVFLYFLFITLGVYGKCVYITYLREIEWQSSQQRQHPTILFALKHTLNEISSLHTHSQWHTKWILNSWCFSLNSFPFHYYILCIFSTFLFVLFLFIFDFDHIVFVDFLCCEIYKAIACVYFAILSFESDSSSFSRWHHAHNTQYI